MAKMNTISTLVFFTIALFWTPSTLSVKTSDVKDKRGAVSGSYGSALSPPYSPPDHPLANSGFTPVAAPVGVYPQAPAPISALLIPGNLLYGQGLDYSGLSYGGYGGYPSVPAAYPLGLNYAAVGSPSVAAYKLGPVTFNPSPAVTPYAAPAAYPSYNILSSLGPDYSGIGSGYSLPSAAYPSHSLGYSPSYGSGSSYSSSYPSSSLSSYSSPSSQSSSTYSSSPPYSAFVGNNHGGSSYSSYSSPSSAYSSSSGYSPSSGYSSYSSPGYSSQSSYSSPSNSYSHSSSSSYPSSVYGPPSYKPGSSLYSKY
ncbi:prisilkin-39-like [Planococcus citri]|uniref:prisilkin-39-like n=1 Tax=Planococcus citri TaxID=170843 RepID=UPI0031F7263C